MKHKFENIVLITSLSSYCWIDIRSHIPVFTNQEWSNWDWKSPQHMSHFQVQLIGHVNRQQCSRNGHTSFIFLHYCFPQKSFVFLSFAAYSLNWYLMHSSFLSDTLLVGYGSVYRVHLFPVRFLFSSVIITISNVFMSVISSLVKYRVLWVYKTNSLLA